MRAAAIVSLLLLALAGLRRCEERKCIESFEPKVYYPVPMYTLPGARGDPVGVAITSRRLSGADPQTECCRDDGAAVRALGDKLRVAGLALIDLGHYLVDDDVGRPLAPRRDALYG